VAQGQPGVDEKSSCETIELLIRSQALITEQRSFGSAPAQLQLHGFCFGWEKAESALREENGHWTQTKVKPNAEFRRLETAECR
jgi:hypothetical protein